MRILVFILLISTLTVSCSSKKKQVLSEREIILQEAKNYLGSNYKYASSNPKQGFDCSGLVHHVYKSVEIITPRSSKDYSGLNKTKLKKADIGDVIVFKGYDGKKKIPGHVGIISRITDDNVYFIHSSTSKGVIESKVKDTYYEKRFLFVVNLLEKKD